QIPLAVASGLRVPRHRKRELRPNSATTTSPKVYGSATVVLKLFPTPSLTTRLYRLAPAKLGSTKICGSADASAVPPNRNVFAAWVVSCIDPIAPDTAVTLTVPSKVDPGQVPSVHTRMSVSPIAVVTFINAAPKLWGVAEVSSIVAMSSGT